MKLHLKAAKISYIHDFIQPSLFLGLHALASRQRLTDLLLVQLRMKVQVFELAQESLYERAWLQPKTQILQRTLMSAFRTEHYLYIWLMLLFKIFQLLQGQSPLEQLRVKCLAQGHIGGSWESNQSCLKAIDRALCCVQVNVLDVLCIT